MKKLITLTSGLILATGMAFAGDEAASSSFQELDKDGNGAISRTEASDSNALMAYFSNADMNRDGQLSETEFASVEPELEEAE